MLMFGCFVVLIMLKMTSKLCPKESKVVLSSKASPIFVNQKDNQSKESDMCKKTICPDEGPVHSTLNA